MSNEVFLLSVVTIASGIIGLCIRYVFKCKCNEIALCCGLITIHRDIEVRAPPNQPHVCCAKPNGFLCSPKKKLLASKLRTEFPPKMTSSSKEIPKTRPVFKRTKSNNSLVSIKVKQKYNYKMAGLYFNEYSP